MPHIVSTLAAGNHYHIYKPKPENNKASGVNDVQKTITINGGSGVAKRGGETGIYTPDGVTTSVSDEDLILLKQNPHFQAHVDGGYLKILNEKSDGEKAAKSLKKDDQGRALTIKDTEEGGRIAGTNKKIKDKKELV